jgi:plastocyanin
VRFAPAGFHTVDLPPKAAGALPLIAPNGQIVAGANDAGGQPFWFNGFPQLGFNHALLKTGWGSKLRYNGSKRITSGLPLGPVKPMTVTFKKAGRFTYYCNIHPGMKGRVTVKPKAKAIPSAAADAGRLKRQIGRDLRLAKGLKRTTAPAATVDVGVNATHGVTYYQMFPRTLEVKPGTTVLFRVPSGHTDVHTATFGPPAYVQPIAKSFQGAPVFDARGVYPSEPPTASLASLTPTLHGNGFWNSGVLDRARATPLPASQAVTFSQAGTYRFQCVIHPNMQGTIVVK